LWPKFALGLSIFAVLAVAAVFLLPLTDQQPGKKQMAKEMNESTASMPEVNVPLETDAGEIGLGDRVLTDELSTATDVFRRKAPALPPAQSQEAERQTARADTDTVPLQRAAKPLAFSDATAGAQVDSRQPATETPATAAVPEPARRVQTTRAFTPAPTDSLSEPSFGQNSPRLAVTGGEVRQAAPSPKPVDTAPGSGFGGGAVATAAFTRLPSEAERRDQTAEELWSQNAQQFVRTEAVLKNESVSQTVVSLGALRNFELQQNATNLRVIDSDGSVYAGFLQPIDKGVASTPTTEAAVRRGVAGELNSGARGGAAPLALSQARTQEYYFNVVGTNRSLRQQLVFTGRLLAPQTGSAGTVDSGDTATSMGLSTADVPVNIPLHQSQISGRAILGEGNELEVEAVARPQ
jgi:hypothetical protein